MSHPPRGRPFSTIRDPLSTRKSITFPFSFILSLLPLHAAAEGDAFPTLICATATLFDCDPERGCERTTARELNTPPFIRLDVEKMLLVGTRSDGSTVVSPIERLNRDGDDLILQGDEAGRGWSAVISTINLQMAVTMSEPDYTIVGFGNCATADELFRELERLTPDEG